MNYSNSPLNIQTAIQQCELFYKYYIGLNVFIKDLVDLIINSLPNHSLKIIQYNNENLTIIINNINKQYILKPHILLTKKNALQNQFEFEEILMKKREIRYKNSQFIMRLVLNRYIGFLEIVKTAISLDDIPENELITNSFLLSNNNSLSKSNNNNNSLNYNNKWTNFFTPLNIEPALMSIEDFYSSGIELTIGMETYIAKLFLYYIKHPNCIVCNYNAAFQQNNYSNDSIESNSLTNSNLNSNQIMTERSMNTQQTQSTNDNYSNNNNTIKTEVNDWNEIREFIPHYKKLGLAAIFVHYIYVYHPAYYLKQKKSVAQLQRKLLLATNAKHKEFRRTRIRVKIKGRRLLIRLKSKFKRIQQRPKELIQVIDTKVKKQVFRVFVSGIQQDELFDKLSKAKLVNNNNSNSNNKTIVDIYRTPTQSNEKYEKYNENINEIEKIKENNNENNNENEEIDEIIENSKEPVNIIHHDKESLTENYDEILVLQNKLIEQFSSFSIEDLSDETCVYGQSRGTRRFHVDCYHEYHANVMSSNNVHSMNYEFVGEDELGRCEGIDTIMSVNSLRNDIRLQLKLQRKKEEHKKSREQELLS